MYVLTVLRISKNLSDPAADFMRKMDPNMQIANVEDVYTGLQDKASIMDAIDRHIYVYFGGEYERVEEEDRVMLLGKDVNYVFKWFWK